MLNVRYILEEIKDQYLIDDRPWIIGFSGGKDSSALLQFVWYAIREIPKEKLTKEIHVVCNDTLVENPTVVHWIDKNLDAIERQAIKEKLPIVVAKTTPALDDSFWVNLIGKGYPAPNRFFRWCTERLKINPTTKYIKEQVAKKGEVIILLGTRKDESSNRKKSIERYQISNNRLRRHVELNLAYIFAPIKEVTTNEIWQYLLQAPSPWNGTNRDLITLYRNGTGGDCPLVIDTTTPSCGQSRFGCWVCTVVNRDKSMEALIDNGDEHLEPLLDLRDWLVENRDKDKYRQMKLRDGRPGKGPYNIDTREYLLRRLLEAEKESGESLITSQELKAIQIIWQMDGFYNNVYETYYKVYGQTKTYEMTAKDKLLQEQQNALKDKCLQEGIDPDKMLNLVKNEKDKKLLKKRKNIIKIIDKVIESELA
ncbi:putative sulfurtransferase DndC [Saprospira grandis DSM 2844]|uniref:Putative sulfurtransferase DndC n=1 Tax=Saprospira grandis DSM 2844 TaxID=694433 RepID=J0XXX9_9BACT|nr:DNA phosphorothioation system sulfurtransferase DndC [Saprospira grandis]EJF53966.1 putative sulfurtransferase DndC [Saprospira grandis DSM 2844]